ncbi:MAG: DHH family phosphoesterase [Candidatus Methanomethylophilaceae archaeon]|jgi:single-stranded-DNA-specific exonuclease
MDDIVLPPKLLKRLSSAAEAVRRHGHVHIFSHYDADGISAAGILAKTLLRTGKEFEVTLLTTLDDPAMDRIRECGSKCLILSDLGASYIPELESLGKDVVVLDHHVPSADSNSVFYANPHLVGIDGMTGACGATMSFLFSLQMDNKNWDLVQIAFAGITGDRQHINGVTDLNALLLNGAVKRGLIRTSPGSLIPPGPLSRSLYLSTDPYIRGVSGDTEGSQRMLADAGVPNDALSSDLDADEGRRLSSLIAVRLAVQGVSVQTMQEISRTRYHLTGWNMDAETMADLFNACGRLGMGGISVGMCLGSGDCLQKAVSANDDYKKRIVSAVTSLDSKGLIQKENIQYFSSTESGFTGIVCGAAMQFIGDPGKPTVGVNCSEDIAKASARGTWAQLDMGVDLSVAMRAAAESVGGNGGGHRIASGASFKSEKKDLFLDSLDQIVGDQIRTAT